MNFTFSKMRQVFFAAMTVLCSLFATNATASHLAAADIFVDYIGTGPGNFRYVVTLQIYRSCQPNAIPIGPNPGPELIDITSSCGYSDLNLPLPYLRVDTVDQLCDTFSKINSCRVPGSPWPAFEKYTYRDTFLLNGPPCDKYVFAWDNCNRNDQILNLIDPDFLCIYIEAGVNNAAKYNNSSPRFLTIPIPYLCVNQPGIFVNGPFDPNTDSLVTVASEAYTAVGTPVDYLNPPYTYLNPVNSPVGYTVNPGTGTALFTPPTQGKFILAFRCTDYDPATGVELGYVMRDVQISVLPCNSPPPLIDSIPIQLTNATFVDNSQGGYIQACPGVPMSFDISGFSQASTNSLVMSSNNIDIAPGSSFSVANQGSNNPTGTFSWTPTGADIGNHTLIVTVKDSTCDNGQPLLLPNYFVVEIKVLPGVDAGPDGKICGLNGTPWQFNVSGPANVDYYWTGYPSGPTLGLSNDFIQNPTAYPPYNFTYIVATDDITSNCKNKDTVTVYIDTSNSVEITPADILICRPGYVQLDAQGIGLKPLANLSCGTTALPVSCLYPDSAEVRTQYSGGSQNPSTVYTPFSGNHRTARMQFLLSRQDLYDYGLRSGTLSSLSFFVTTPTPTTYNNFSISIKCTDRTELTQASGGFEPGTIPVYTAIGPVTPSLGWNVFPFDQGYDWDSTKALIVEVCYSNATNGTATAVNAVQTQAQTMITSWSNVGSGNICQNPTIASTTETFYYRPTIKLNYCPAPEAEFDYTWGPGNFLSDSTIKNPVAYISESISYNVYTRGRNGCLVTDKIDIVLPEHAYDVWPKDTSICFGQSYKMTTNDEGANIEWFFVEEQSASPGYVPATTDILSCLNCADPIATPQTSGRYIAVFTDHSQCKDTVEVEVEVRPLPDVYILNPDTTIKYGQNIELQVAGAYIYNWAPVSTLSNPNIVNPLATPSEPVTYTVVGLADNGCRNIDTVRINIDYRDNLFVPTAFTPNGDGKNDIFKVANLTFQKLQEFRVFNRWGQELFRTNDPNIGWDGTWKNIPQDMGAYQYLIRVAYPDGYLETYKGDVTLIR